MGKRLRYIILTFTVVLAVFAFAMLWQVRPGFDSKVLDEARARQEKTLLEVSEPLKTDIVELTEEEEMARKVTDLLLADESFLQSISDKLENTIPGYVEAYTSKYTNELDANIRASIDASLDAILDGERDTFYQELQDGIMARVDEKLDEREAGYLAVLDEREAALIEKLTTDIWTTYETKKAELTADILTQVETIGTEMINDASDATEIAVLNRIYEQEDYFVDLVASAFADGIYRAANGEVVDPYTGIVTDASGAILDGLAGKGMTDEEKTKAAIENIVLQVLDRIDVDDFVERLETLESIPVTEASTFSTEDRETSGEEVRVPSPVRISTPPVQKVREDGKFPATAEEYENERERLRKAEIDRILSGLMK